MRRFAAIVGAAVLTMAMAASVTASPRQFFNGDFDVLVGGAVFGHVEVRIHSTDFSSSAGTYTFIAPDGGIGRAPIAEAAFYRNAEQGYDEAWFKGLEIWYATDGSLPGNNVFVGHFVDRVDPAEADFIEFFGQHILGDQGVPYTLSDPYYGHFDIGEGSFVLHVGD